MSAPGTIIEKHHLPGTSNEHSRLIAYLQLHPLLVMHHTHRREDSTHHHTCNRISLPTRKLQPEALRAGTAGMSEAFTIVGNGVVLTKDAGTGAAAGVGVMDRLPGAVVWAPAGSVTGCVIIGIAIEAELF
jgi:hypothetical protein